MRNSIIKNVSVIFQLLLLIFSGCKNTPGGPEIDENTNWQKIEVFENLAIHYIKPINGKLFVSATDETTYRGTPHRGKLYMTEDGIQWQLIRETSWAAGPITFHNGQYYWVADTIHVTSDFVHWEAITMRLRDGSVLTMYPSNLNDIVFHNDTLYGSEVSGATYIIRNNEDIEKVTFDDHRFAGARKYFTIGENNIIAIQNGGHTVYGDRPFRFQVPDGVFMDGDFVPPSSNIIAASTAFQYHDSTYYIASNFPDLVRSYQGGKWVAITDTIPTTEYLEYYNDYVLNWALYIEFVNNEMYIGTRLGGVMKWDTTQHEWIFLRDGLPRRDFGPNDPRDDFYYPVHHFESFKGSLFAGFGFLDASSDPALVPLKYQGLYKFTIND